MSPHAAAAGRPAHVAGVKRLQPPLGQETAGQLSVTWRSHALREPGRWSQGCLRGLGKGCGLFNGGRRKEGQTRAERDRQRLRDRETDRGAGTGTEGQRQGQGPGVCPEARAGTARRQQPLGPWAPGGQFPPENHTPDSERPSVPASASAAPSGTSGGRAGTVPPCLRVMTRDMPAAARMRVGLGPWDRDPVVSTAPARDSL